MNMFPDITMQSKLMHHMHKNPDKLGNKFINFLSDYCTIE